jgi:hypothetical protein
MTPELLVSIAGIILSLAFSYIPGLAGKFAGLESVYKRLITLGLALVAAAGVFGLSCAGLIDSVTCDQDGAWGLLQLFIYAAIANQAAYTLSPETQVVQDAKLERDLGYDLADRIG